MLNDLVIGIHFFRLRSENVSLATALLGDHLRRNSRFLDVDIFYNSFAKCKIKLKMIISYYKIINCNWSSTTQFLWCSC